LSSKVKSETVPPKVVEEKDTVTYVPRSGYVEAKFYKNFKILTS